MDMWPFVAVVCLCPVAAFCQTPKAVNKASVSFYDHKAGPDTVLIKRVPAEHYYLKVFDVIGRVVMSKEIETKEFGVSSCQFQKGSYTYTVSDAKSNVIRQGTFTVAF